MANIDTIAAVECALIGHLGDLARAAAEMHGYTRDIRRQPDGSSLRQFYLENAKISLGATRSSLQHLLHVVEQATAAVGAELAPEPKQLGDVAAVALSDCLAASPMSERLVPRFPAVKSSGASGVAVRATMQDPQP